MKLHVRRLDGRAGLPSRAHADDAGLDLHALEDALIAPGERRSIRTGIAIEVPEGHAGLVLPRSGLALRHGIALVNAPGLIDPGYRGEVRILLLNSDRHEPFKLRAAERIAQLVLVRTEAAAVLEVDELPRSSRGTGGFGSSGA